MRARAGACVECPGTVRYAFDSTFDCASAIVKTGKNYNKRTVSARERNRGREREGERTRAYFYLPSALPPQFSSAAATGTLNTGELMLAKVPGRFLYVVKKISCAPRSAVQLYFGASMTGSVAKLSLRYRAKIKDIGAGH